MRKAGVAAYRQTDKLQLLMEQWVACNGEWAASEFVKTVKLKRRNRKVGTRKWLTQSEIAQKYASGAIAQAICAAKMADEEVCKEQVRCHPDMNGVDRDEPRSNGTPS